MSNAGAAAEFDAGGASWEEFSSQFDGAWDLLDRIDHYPTLLWFLPEIGRFIDRTVRGRRPDWLEIRKAGGRVPEGNRAYATMRVHELLGNAAQARAQGATWLDFTWAYYRLLEARNAGPRKRLRPLTILGAMADQVGDWSAWGERPLVLVDVSGDRPALREGHMPLQSIGLSAGIAVGRVNPFSAVVRFASTADQQFLYGTEHSYLSARKWLDRTDLGSDALVESVLPVVDPLRFDGVYVFSESPVVRGALRDGVLGDVPVVLFSDMSGVDAELEWDGSVLVSTGFSRLLFEAIDSVVGARRPVLR